MKVAFFGAKKYDIDTFDSALRRLSGDDVELTYIEARLDASTAPLAEGHSAICVFVNDTCDEEVLLMLKAHGVQFILLRCAGFNNVDLTTASKLGIKVARVPSYSPEAVAEFAVGMILTVVRKYHKSFVRVREGNFLLDGLLGFNLAGKTVAIIGTGKIGILTGKILSRGFSCNVLAYDPYPSDLAAEYGIRYVDELEDLLRQADIVSLHCPLNDRTAHIINDHTLSCMKKGAVLINTSRGGLIDTTALIRALKSDHLGAVGLDVYEKESTYFYQDSSSKIIHDDIFARLLSFYNVFMTGHQAFLTTEALTNIADTTLQNLVDLESKGTCGNVLGTA